MNDLMLLALMTLAGMIGGTLIAGLLTTMLRPSLRGLAPRWRRRMLTSLLALPLISSAALLAALCAPTALPRLTSDWAHCLNHAAAHPSHCHWHLPQVVVPEYLFVLIAALAATGVGWLVWRGLQLWRGSRRLKLLRGMAQWQPAGYWLLPTEHPLAFTGGVPSSQCYISRGLLDRLTPAAFAIVLAHEQQHLASRDTWRALLTATLACLHWPSTGRMLRREWTLALEQSCDDQVARNAGSRVAVAQCLLDVARLRDAQDDSYENSTAPAGCCHLLDDNLSARINALLTAAQPAGSSYVVAPLLIMTSLTGFIVTSGPALHHWMEWLLPAAGL